MSRFLQQLVRVNVTLQLFKNGSYNKVNVKVLSYFHTSQRFSLAPTRAGLWAMRGLIFLVIYLPKVLPFDFNVKPIVYVGE